MNTDDERLLQLYGLERWCQARQDATGWELVRVWTEDLAAAAAFGLLNVALTLILGP
jgi:hypothetical protein